MFLNVHYYLNIFIHNKTWIVIIELTSNKEAQLNKWYKVISMNGEPVSEIYVRFARVYDAGGNSLYIIPKTDIPVFVELEYNGTGYP
jgi:hypothetical protein